MALITPGPMVGQISGRLGSVIYSHNRGGPYVRNGTIPTTVTSQPALDAKARLAGASQLWRTLTNTQQQAWRDWALTNPVINRLGSSTTLQGNAAFNRLNSNIFLAAGSSITEPPVNAPPASLASASLTTDIGAGDLALTFAPSPLPANTHLVIMAAVVNSAGINYVRNLLRQVTVTGAAQTSPYDFEADLTARFGTLSVGQKVVILASTLDSTSGLVSQPVRREGIIVST